MKTILALIFLCFLSACANNPRSNARLDAFSDSMKALNQSLGEIQQDQRRRQEIQLRNSEILMNGLNNNYNTYMNAERDRQLRQQEYWNSKKPQKIIICSQNSAIGCY
jgi:hypothetical protein